MSPIKSWNKAEGRGWVGLCCVGGIPHVPVEERQNTIQWPNIKCSLEVPLASICIHIGERQISCHREASINFSLAIYVLLFTTTPTFPLHFFFLGFQIFPCNTKTESEYYKRLRV